MYDSSPGKVIRIIQITDCHLFEDPSGLLLKMDTQESFEKVLGLASRESNDVDVVLASGDIAQDATPGAYRRAAAGLAQLGAPVYWFPGNHDKRSVMRQVDSAALQNLIRLSDWQIILLDSSVDDSTFGYLAQDQLDHLVTALESVTRNDKISHSLICLHHNPVPASAEWMKDIGLRNDREFLEILGRFDSVRGVVYGHIHQELDFVHEGIRFLSTPSTCIQFKPGVSDFALDERNPGYRWLQLNPDGSIQSAVERVTDHVFTADYSSTGY